MQISVIIFAAVDLLAWSPDGSMYVMVTGDHIDVCAFEVGDVMLDLLLNYFIFIAREVALLPWFVFLLEFFSMISQRVHGFLFLEVISLWTKSDLVIWFNCKHCLLFFCFRRQPLFSRYTRTYEWAALHFHRFIFYLSIFYLLFVLFLLMKKYTCLKHWSSKQILFVFMLGIIHCCQYFPKHTNSGERVNIYHTLLENVTPDYYYSLLAWLEYHFPWHTGTCVHSRCK